MKISSQRLFLAVLVLTSSLIGASANALTYSLSADWSDSSNPNGAWTYGYLSTDGAFTAFSTHVPNYINIGPAAFGGPQSAWTRCTDTGNNGCPEGLARSVGNALVDLPVGQVGGHTPVSGSLAVQWTAPSAGMADVSGSTWMLADFQGRRLETSLVLNTAALYQSVLLPTQAQGTNSSSPQTFAQAIALAGGNSISLLGIGVLAGDKLTWSVTEAPGSTEWFAGVDMVVALTPVPEAGTFAMTALGLLLLVVAVKRQKS